ncbi:MAG TPA: four helix bundle protein [Ferruginibacter sp.]|nr:four helix bundle protein [Ferruginibacter sp.]HRE64931.1 four helix bundle protein [Ferruginibacter sp.]
MSTIKKFTDLEVWQLSNELEQKIFSILQTTTLANDFALKDQMNKSVGSIPDNIAEGFSRGGRLEFIQFLSIARASASELQSQIIRCNNRNHIDKNLCHELINQVEIIGKKIGAFIQYLNHSEKSGPKFQHRVTTYNQKPETNNQKPETVKTKNAAKPLGAYPHARKVGNLLFLSGIGSRQASDNKIPGLELDGEGNIVKYDIEAECRSVFANVKAVLEASGSSWDKIVDVTVFLTNMKKDFPVYNKIYGEYFDGVEACRTTVEVKSLPTPICIELKVIATME